MHHFLGLLALYGLLWAGRLVFQLLTHRQAVFLPARRGLQRVCHPVVLDFAEVVHQQVAGYRGHPGHQRGPRPVKGAQGAVNLDEYFLRQVGSVIGRARKPVADVIDAPMVLLDDFLPCRGVARYTATDKRVHRLVVVQLILPTGQLPGPEILMIAKYLYGSYGIGSSIHWRRAAPEISQRIVAARPKF